MQEQESKQSHECQCIGNKKAKKLEKEIEELREKISLLENCINRLRKAIK